MNFAAVVGVYGVSGSGKSRALSLLAKARPEWHCLEGSQVIEQLLSENGETLRDFQQMEESAREEIRNRAAKMIQNHYGVTIVAGHISFPVGTLNDQDTGEACFENVFTTGDAALYSAILYLDKPPDVVYRQRKQDNDTSHRSRSELPMTVIEQWVQHEKKLLQQMCMKHGIHFALMPDDDILEDYITEHILSPLVTRIEEKCQASLLNVIHAVPSASTFLLIDGDRTLCPVDTGILFFDDNPGTTKEDILKKIFKRYPDYTFQAFLEVAMLYERFMSSSEYAARSRHIGKAIQLYSEWVTFLTSLPPDVHAIVVTSGIREVWESALLSTFGANHGIDLIAGNHIGLHPYIVNHDAKAMVASELRKRHGGCKIISFGDSAIDIPMIRASDRGYVVIDDRGNRSMREFLRKAIADRLSNRLRQLVLSNAPKAIHEGIPVGSLERLLEELQSPYGIHKVLDYSSCTSAAILATQTRRSDLGGPSLQKVHVEVGRFLAERLLEEFPWLAHESEFSHVQGTTFQGMVGIETVLILPLMRGGEPMARGVYEAFPSAQFLHFWDEMKTSTLQETLNKNSVTDVVIVDSVVNEGRSVRRVIEQIRLLVDSQRLRLYVLTAVMQKEASLKLPLEFPRTRFLALRISENKYTGRGGTDTGNRLFGTI